jgi:cell division protein FtsZ
VEFLCANTDAPALDRNQAKVKLQLGSSGLGSGGKPDAGRAAAQSKCERISEALEGAHMVFVIAGMGGGTGTGAAPVVAEVARGKGIFTVAVVTKPFAFEGKRMKVAEAGLEELSQRVDALIVILNETLMEVLGDDVSVEEAFTAADNVLHNAVAGIAEVINSPGMVNVDFEDVLTIMEGASVALMGSAFASGIDRARIAAEQAVASPLMEGISLACARGVLVNITASRSLKMKEVTEVMNTIREFAADDATIIFGAVYNDDIGDDLRVTVVATRLVPVKPHQPKPPTPGGKSAAIPITPRNIRLVSSGSR